MKRTGRWRRALGAAVLLIAFGAPDRSLAAAPPSVEETIAVASELATRTEPVEMDAAQVLLSRLGFGKKQVAELQVGLLRVHLRAAQLDADADLERIVVVSASSETSCDEGAYVNVSSAFVVVVDATGVDAKIVLRETAIDREPGCGTPLAREHLAESPTNERVQLLHLRDSDTFDLAVNESVRKGDPRSGPSTFTARQRVYSLARGKLEKLLDSRIVTRSTQGEASSRQLKLAGTPPLGHVPTVDDTGAEELGYVFDPKKFKFRRAKTADLPGP